MEFNRMQQLKRRFFAMRNGIVADTLRRGGSPFRVIFGLNLPQLKEIAAEFGPDATLGRELWANVSTRESMLLAPMLLTEADVDIDEALVMLADSPATEVTDILCHSLLRRHNAAMDICRRASETVDANVRYGAIRLAANMFALGNKEAEDIARRLNADPDRRVALTAQRLIDDIEFLLN